MKIVRFLAEGRASYGLLEGETVQAIKGTPFRRIEPAGRSYRLGEVRLLAPCTPSKIVAVGLNYRQHAGELNMTLPQVPLVFLKPSTSVIGPDDSIVCPPSSKRVDFEGELGVVIKRVARHVPEDHAMEYVLGFTCLNDVTARDLQSQDGQWTRAKGFDSFCPIGPCIETGLDPSGLAVETRLNGARRQYGSVSNLIFSVPKLVSFISSVMTLLPGDVIATGTPDGIGPMDPGDVVEVIIAPIGSLRNRVVAG